MECAIKPLILSISSRVIRCGPRLDNVIEITKLLDKGTFKIMPLVRMNTGWYTTLGEPICHLDVAHSRGMLVLVGMATVYLLKSSVRTSTFPHPSLEGSRIVKSVARISLGRDSSRWLIYVRTAG